MNTPLFVLDWLIAALRGGLLAFAVVVAILCVLDWLVRTRRINPFGRFAAFVRGAIRPFTAAVERRILRAGGNPVAAPWWTLVAVALGSIVLLSLLDFVREQVALAAGYYRLLVSWTFGVLKLALIVRVLLSWMRPPPFAWYVRWSYALTEWFLRPLRGIIPLVGMVDITPLIAYFALGIVQGFLVRLA